MRKRALLVGINNYRKPDCALEGCVADIDSMAGLLKRYYGFRDAGMTILADADATKPNIVAGLNELLFDFDDRTEAVFMFSGHGTQVSICRPGGLTGSESAIVTQGMTGSSLVTDSELHSLIWPKVRRFNGRFTAIFDCGMSAGDCAAGTGRPGDMVDRSVKIEPLPESFTELRQIESAGFDFISACDRNQVAAELRKLENGRQARGAFSYTLQKVLQRQPDISVDRLRPQVLAGIRELSHYQQIPRYSFSDRKRPLFG